MGMCGKPGDGGAARQERERQARIKLGTEAIDTRFSGFNDKFYNKRAQAVSDANMPQLEQEHARTKNSLGYALASRGLLNSSVRDQRENSLENELEKQRRAVGDQGLSQANDLRAKVEDSRNTIYSQLLQSADPAQATATATRESANLTAPSPVTALGGFFRDWTEMNLMRSAAGDSGPSGGGNYSFGGTPSSSSRIVR